MMGVVTARDEFAAVAAMHGWARTIQCATSEQARRLPGWPAVSPCSIYEPAVGAGVPRLVFYTHPEVGRLVVTHDTNGAVTSAHWQAADAPTTAVVRRGADVSEAHYRRQTVRLDLRHSISRAEYAPDNETRQRVIDVLESAPAVTR